jgi:methyl-accepting chemotaxis protein
LTDGSRGRVLRFAPAFRLKAILLTVGFFLASQALTVFLFYATVSQEISRSFFSAHRDLQRIWEQLLPLMVGVGGGVWLAIGLPAVLTVILARRSLERQGGELDEALVQLGQGNFKGALDPDQAQHLRPISLQLEASRTSVQQHLQEVKSIGAEMNRSIARLNYTAFERGEVTMGEVKEMASTLNTLSREMNNALKWFEV